VITIARIPTQIAAGAHPILLTELLASALGVVATRTQGCEPLERRKCFRRQALFPTVFGDRDSVVDNFRSRNFAVLETGFATRMLR
jgi:hypothetical protein